MMVVGIALRNLARNKRRTIITTGAMAFALFFMIVYKSLIDGIMVEFAHNAVALDLSMIQIHHPDYRDNPSMYTMITDTESVIRRIEQTGFNAAPRLYAFGLAASGNHSAGVEIHGVDIQRESRVTELHKHILEGQPLLEADPSGVVIGRGLAKSLGVGIGGEIVMVGQAMDGSIANDLFRVRGILKTVSTGIDRSGLFMTRGSFMSLMGMEDGAHEIAVNLPEPNTLDEAVTVIKGLFPELETLTWRELAPELSQMLDSIDISMMLLYIIFYSAIALVTLNAMLMAVFERIREIGIMKAVGLAPRQIWRMVIIEALAQSFLASILGILAGMLTAYWLQNHGIDLSSFGEGSAISGVAMDAIWTSHVTLRTAWEPTLFMIGMVLLAVIYPGLKAALIRPVKAIYHR